jgi:general secretion pathway protein F
MPTFKYQAMHAETARTQQGLIEAETARLARVQLREQGWLVSEIQELRGKQHANAFVRRNRLSRVTLTLLTRQFATLLEAGLPVEQVLLILIDQAEEQAAQELFAAVRGEVLAGNALHTALAQHPQVFDALYLALVHAGEATGRLAQVFIRLADYIEDSQALRAKIIAALIYPCVLMGVGSLVVMGLMTFVVPQIAQVFVKSKQALPLLTLITLTLSQWIRQYFWGIAIIAVLLPITWRQVLRQPALLYWLHGQQLRLPLLGQLTRTANSARFASTLAILAGSGVPLLTALHAAAEVVHNLPMRAAVQVASKQVREGASLSLALKSQAIFPPVLVHLIATGERTGQLESMLERAAKQQSNELSGRLSRLTSLLEPLLILSMALVVLLIVLSVLLPIMQMNQLLKV